MANVNNNSAKFKDDQTVVSVSKAGKRSLKQKAESVAKVKRTKQALNEVENQLVGPDALANSQETRTMSEESEGESEHLPGASQLTGKGRRAACKDQSAQFEEEGNQVKMRVTAEEDDFSSDEEEDGELNETGSESDGGHTESFSESTKSEGSEDEYSQRSYSPRKRKRRRSKRRSECKRVVEKIDTLSNSLSTLQTLMVQNGLLGNQQMPGKDEMANNQTGSKSIPWTNSETTIYRNAVPNFNPAKPSETVQVDSEVEFVIKDNGPNNNEGTEVDPVSMTEPVDFDEGVANVTDQFIADCAAEAERRRSKDRSELGRPEQMVKDAETSKAHILGTMWGPQGCGDHVGTTWGQCGDHGNVQTTWGQH